MDILTGRIVVGYDGSEQSGVAVDWAAAEARRRRLPLTILHVVDYLGLMPNTMGPSGWPAAFADQASRVAAAGAARAREREPGIDATALTRLNGVAGGLIEVSTDAALLVVGTHGHGGLPGLLLGSVALAVSGHARCPVVVVRGDVGRRVGPDRPVVVGFDGSPAATAAVRYAADVAADTGAPLTVITAYRPAPWLIGAVSPGHRDDAHRDHEALAREAAREVALGALRTAREHHPTLPATQRAIHGAAADILASAAERAGLLVVGSRGHGGFTGLILGSVGHRVIHSAPCPVAIVHGEIPQTQEHSETAAIPQPI